MAKTTGRHHTRTAARAAAAALTAALVATGTSAVAADAPQPSLRARADQPAAAAAAATPRFNLCGIDSNLFRVCFESTREGGFVPDNSEERGWSGIRAVVKVDHTGDGRPDGIYTFGNSGSVNYRPPSELWGDDVGYGWDIYNMTFSPGNIGGDVPSDILARDSKGDLYLYLGYESGKLAKRTKVGYGWDIYTAFAGNGDLDGDGKNDFVARDKSGVLWLYKGTGDADAPYAKRTKIGSGWNTYDWLISTGDVNRDGRSDLLARDKSGVLWRYEGTGDAAAPYKPKAKISGGWNIYSFLY